MDNIENVIDELRDKADRMTEEKNEEIIEYLNDIYDTDFTEDRDFSDFSQFYDEDEADDGYLDPMDLAMDEDDVNSFQKWSYRLSLILHTENIADILEKIEDNGKASVKKELISTAKAIESYKDRLTEIIEFAEYMKKEADSLIEIIEEYSE